jgi:prepilin-type N-terminal cleavage/methylation domain-containing protein
MKNDRTGFTLVEIVVVCLIMAILASIALPYYLKTIEMSKASDAVALGNMVSTANRMYRIDNRSNPVSNGYLTNQCNNGTSCAATALSDVCRLVRCNYVAQQNWDSSAYRYFIVGSGGASVTRRNGSGKYTGWGYSFDTSGGCVPVGGAPDCPKF